VRDDPELQSQLERLARVRKQLVPMSVLFFCMASINTFLDSTKDVLVVTMSGGGAEVRVL
jgi:ATP/ADP translocase